MRIYLVPPMLTAAAAVLASNYSLSVNPERRGDTVVVATTVRAPAGTTLRYEIVAHRQGRSNSNSKQSGSVEVDIDGTVALSRLSLSVAPGDRCEVSVKVYEAASDRLVAAEVADCGR